MKKLIVLLFVCLVGCTYSPKYVVVQDSYNTYAPNYSRTTTNEWSKDLKAVQSEFNQSLNKKPKKTKKTTKYIYEVKR
jgi:ABC-type transporter lipoprotein component MlaA